MERRGETERARKKEGTLRLEAEEEMLLDGRTDTHIVAWARPHAGADGYP